MKTKLAAVAVALLLVGTGAAVASPGNAPDGVPADDHAQDDSADENESDADENESDADENEANESADERRGPPADVPGPATDGNASQGPPTDMPAQVPEFVGDIHEAIGAHIDGMLSGSELGERISSLTPGGDADDGAPEDAGNASDAPATDTPTPAGDG